MSESFTIGSQAPEAMPEYMQYLFKTFAKDLQGKIVRCLYNTKVFVKPIPDEDKVVVEISHKELPITYSEDLDEITGVIRESAKDDRVISSLVRSVVQDYKDSIWHMFFYDFKKTRNTSEKVVKKQFDLNDRVEAMYAEGSTVSAIAQTLDISQDQVYQILQINEASKIEEDD